MLAVQGYYDGVAIKPLEELLMKPNQRVIITIMDDFVEPIREENVKGMRGALAKYANPALIERESEAWQQAMEEKHGNI